MTKELEPKKNNKKNDNSKINRQEKNNVPPEAKHTRRIPKMRRIPRSGK